VTFIAKVPLVACIRVCPSGVDLASAVAALTVPSPGRFSMANGLPRRCPNFGASTRATELVVPPTANGTMIVTVRTG